jgi:hypothetical protein
MAVTNETERLAPFLEGLERRILQTAFGMFDGSEQTSPGLLDQPLQLPEYQVAGLDPLQTAAMQQSQAQFGSFQPYLQAGAEGTQLGIGAVLSGLGFLRPDAAQQFMNPYQSNVIDEINRQAAIGQQGIAQKAITSGAFGGSREGVQRAEAEGRRLATVGEAQRKGYQDAVAAAQRAAQLSGGLGQAIGQQASTLGDIGRLQSELGRADIQSLTSLGSARQAQSQAELDAQRQNLMQQYQDPFTRLQLGSQLLKGTPSGSLSSTFQSVTQPQANPFLQGLGFATYGQSQFGGPTAA